MILTLTKILLTLLTLLALLLVTVMVYSMYQSRPLFNAKLAPDQLAQQTLAPTAKALTFARTDDDRLLLVIGLEHGQVRGLDLSQHFPGQPLNPMDLYNNLGFEALAALANDSATTNIIEIPVARLVTPMDFSFPHIAVGTNYTDHAEEVYVDDPPFLFPKLAHASSWHASVDADSSSHLDYEAEICLIPLQDIKGPDAQVTLGLILCNDFTDRWSLLKELRLGQPMGTTGFATSKGRAGYLPVGYLLVIPHNPEFYADINLQLYVNQGMRQNISARQMILKPQDIINGIFAAASQTYYQGKTIVPLLPAGHIPAGTLLLSGTGGGVIFKPLNAWNPWLYLKRGDKVITTANFLGHLDNAIE